MKNKKKNDFVKYMCPSCGSLFSIEVEEDEFTTKITCSKCHKKMYKVKDEKTK